MRFFKVAQWQISTMSISTKGMAAVSSGLDENRTWRLFKCNFLLANDATMWRNASVLV